MQPEAKGAAYLWDMLDAARAIEQFVGPRSFEHYEADPNLTPRFDLAKRSGPMYSQASRDVTSNLSRCRGRRL